jgi:hypothetical protein
MVTGRWQTVSTEQQWEYCALRVASWEWKGEQCYCDLSIRYFGRENGFHILSVGSGADAKAWAYNPWERAFGLLGLAGWELVSVQHATETKHTSPEILCPVGLAYFKRPAKEGRRVDEPALALE